MAIAKEGAQKGNSFFSPQLTLKVSVCLRHGNRLFVLLHYMSASDPGTGNLENVTISCSYFVFESDIG